MKVHITYTPDVDRMQVKKIVKKISEINGPIQFESTPSVSFDKLEQFIGPFVNQQPLEFETFFNICNYYRANKSLIHNDFVVVLTTLTNRQFWFSNFDKRNIFININEWNYLKNTLRNNAISYQIIGNIFHSLIGIDSNNFRDDPKAHKISIGCISDYCNNKSEILLKFRTGYICDDCIRNFNQRVTDKGVIKQIYLIIQELRKSFVEFEFEEVALQPLPLRIDDNLEVYIGDKNIHLQPLLKTLYFYTLLNPDGIKSDKLRNKLSRELISTIYKKINGYNENRSFESLGPILKLCSASGSVSQTQKSSFQETKSKINGIIARSGVDPIILDFYTINNKNDRDTKGAIFKIDLNVDYMDIDNVRKII